MNVVWIVQWFRSAPDDSKSRCDIGSLRCVGELHALTVDGVSEQVGVHTSYPAFNVELTYKPSLYYELLK